MQYESFMPWGGSPGGANRSRPQRVAVPNDFGHAPFVSPEVNEDTEERIAVRWRSTVLRLSDRFTTDSASHPDLAPILMEALGNALEQLLLFGRARDLDVLEEWLDTEPRFL